MFNQAFNWSAWLKPNVLDCSPLAQICRNQILDLNVRGNPKPYLALEALKLKPNLDTKHSNISLAFRF